MESLEIKNYYISIFGDPSKFKQFIGNLAEGIPKCLTISRSLVVCTFQSTFSVDQIKEQLFNISENTFGFILVELKKGDYGVSVAPYFYDFLFTHIVSSENTFNQDFNDIQPPIQLKRKVPMVKPTMDQLLDKVFETGKDSLTTDELELLNQYSKEITKN